MKRAARGSLKIKDAKNRQKFAIWAMGVIFAISAKSVAFAAHCVKVVEDIPKLSRTRCSPKILVFGDISCHTVAIAYIDLQKAFDSVCHQKLFTRLSSLGICVTGCPGLRIF